VSTSPQPRAVTLFYDQDCGVCTAIAQRLARASGGLVSIREAALDDSIIVERDGIRTTHADAIAALSRALPAPFPLLRACAWPGIRVVVNLGYRTFARHRHHISRWLGLTECRVRPNPGTSDDAD
jgi:predicted DCC family thiol-disulfide oxidoreductase YuxK